MPARRDFGAVRRLPSGRWQARYLTPNGERVGAPRTFTTKGEAHRWLSGVEADLIRGDWHDVRLGEVPFLHWQEQWLATKRPKLQPATVELYTYLLRRHIVPRFGQVPVGRITALEVQAWLADLHTTSSLSPNTVAKAYRLMKGVMDAAVDAGLIPKSPCTIRGAATERHEEMQIATPEQVAHIANAAGERWAAFILTAAYSGLRWGELAGLRRIDIKSATGTVEVRRKLSEVNGRLSYGAPKTAAGRRNVGIPGFVMRELEVHIATYAEEGPHGLVFPAAEGGPLRRSNFRRRVWVPATEAAGVPGLRFHDLRHTAATLAAASGTSLRALMTRIGHASAAAALRYQHVVEGQDEDIVRYLERFEASGSAASGDHQ